MRLLVRRLLQIGRRCLRLLLAQQQDAEIQLGLVQVRLQLQNLLILSDGLGVLLQHALGKRQVEVGGIVGGIGRDGFSEILRRLLVLLRLQGFTSFFVEVGALQKKQKDRDGSPHSFYFTLSDCDVTRSGSGPQRIQTP